MLKELSPQFEAVYSHAGRPSIAPERWLRALVRQALCTVRRERLLREPWADNLLCRGLVGLTMDDPLWEASTFSKNRARLLAGDVAHAVFAQVLAQARERELRSDEHFTVDGTLSEAWAGQKRFKRKEAASSPPPPDGPGHPSIDCRGERRTTTTHAAPPAPEARLDNKAQGQEATRADVGHVLMENRHGLVVDSAVTQATGTAGREAALPLAEAMPGPQRITWGADKSDETHDWVREWRGLRVTPPVAQPRSGRSSAIDGRTTRRPGDAVRQRQRKGVEAIFGWMNPGGWRRQTRDRGVARGGWLFTVAAAVDHLVRMRTLAAVA